MKTKEEIIKQETLITIITTEQPIFTWTQALNFMEKYEDQFRQARVIKSICHKCRVEMEGATYRGYKMCHICREWQTVNASGTCDCADINKIK